MNENVSKYLYGVIEKVWFFRWILTKMKSFYIYHLQLAAKQKAGISATPRQNNSKQIIVFKLNLVDPVFKVGDYIIIDSCYGLVLLSESMLT